MPRSSIPQEELDRIQRALSDHPIESVAGAHSLMKYKRRTQVKDGNLVLQARRKRFEATADDVGAGSSLTMPDQPEPATEEEKKAIEAAMMTLDGGVLLKMMTGSVDYYAIIRKCLEQILADNKQPAIDIEGGDDGKSE